MIENIGCIHNFARIARIRWIERGLLRQMKCRDREGTSGRYVTYLCTAGLGNRLAAHIVAHAYALRTGRQLIVSWIRNWHCGATFNDLFEPVFPSHAAYRTKTILRESHHRNSALANAEDPPEDLVAFDSQFFPSDLHRLREEDARHLGEILSNLRPRPEIIREVDRVARTFPRPIVGVHIRLGDFKVLGRAVPIKTYIKVLSNLQNRFGPRIVCYLASDGTEDELFPFQQHFTCIRYSQGEKARDTIEDITMALVDLLLLARTDIVVQAPLSSLSNVAAFLGNVESIEV